MHQPWPSTHRSAEPPPGDGWDLTFRLYHPNENAGYTEYTEATYRYRLDTKADPAFELEGVAKEWTITGDRLMEGVATNLSLDLVNYGTSLAVDVTPVLTCEGAQVLSSPEPFHCFSPVKA